MHRLIAQNCIPNIPPEIGCIIPPAAQPSITSPQTFLVALASWLIGFAGILAVIAIVWSGILYMTSAGDEQKAATAKANLIWAITGLIVFLSVFIIIRWIRAILTGTT